MVEVLPFCLSREISVISGSKGCSMTRNLKVAGSSPTRGGYCIWAELLTDRAPVHPAVKVGSSGKMPLPLSLV